MVFWYLNDSSSTGIPLLELEGDISMKPRPVSLPKDSRSVWSASQHVDPGLLSTSEAQDPTTPLGPLGQEYNGIDQISGGFIKIGKKKSKPPCPACRNLQYFPEEKLCILSLGVNI